MILFENFESTNLRPEMSAVLPTISFAQISFRVSEDLRCPIKEFPTQRPSQMQILQTRC
ncbi:MAG: hypothetical protein Fues2KO_37510 [Fuerstiella sp.]